MDKAEKIILFIVLGVIACCLILAICCAVVFRLSEKLIPTVPTPAMPTKAACSVPLQETIITSSADSIEIQAAAETENSLEQIVIPTADITTITEKMTGVDYIPTQLDTAPILYQLGDELTFYKLTEDDVSVATTATLRYATESVYFWAENDLYLEEDDLQNLVDTFADEIYPTNQEFFGTEWIPGVDNDPHLYILYAGGLGDTLAGYTATTDTVLPEAHPYSNAHEMFVINADEESLTDPYTLSTMAHEFQHLIHGYRDPNEELWLNEGFSELATLLNGYDAGGFDYLFTSQPDMQLNNWSADPDLDSLNYGASYLFSTYLLSRFGENITRAVVNDQQNGFVSIDSVFNSNNLIDPLTGDVITSDEFFRDWTITNYLNDPDLYEGRYYYSNYDSVPTVNDTEWLGDCNGSAQVETVHQFGTDYYEIGCSGIVTLKFNGNDTVAIIPDDAENSTYMMWSNRGDASDMTSTREFDLTPYSGSLTLGFDVWYDLETDFDYAYLEASVEGGKWQILNSNYCTTLDPNGNNYGCGFNGQTNGWQHVSVDLSQFAGSKVALRFEYITDGALSTEGFAVDNLSIPEIGYTENFEEGDGGWTMEGFARIKNSVPQSFLVTLITSDPTNPIHKYHVNPGEELELVIDPYCYSSYQAPILVVSGTSRFTRESAEYSISLME